MKKKVLRMTLISLILIAAVTAVMAYGTDKYMKTASVGENIVLLNEINRLSEQEDSDGVLQEKIKELEQQLRISNGEIKTAYVNRIVIIDGILLGLCAVIIFLYIYIKIIRPFERLENYAQNIAQGNLDVDLRYERENFFGAFTWAFDHMRKEIIKARNGEKAAIKENKTVIAALSHDIKTPIASIRAYAEGLEAGIDKDYEKRQHYIATIMKKCDEVTALTNDLVLHSLSELSSLSVENEKTDIAALLLEVLKNLEYPLMTVHYPICEAESVIDSKRFAQVIENVLNNARKYAEGSIVEVWSECRDEEYCIHIRDYGNGIPPEDMPFIYDKFYRGKNVKDKQGSGLGLYIVDYLMKRMNGHIELVNSSNGLEVILFFPLKIS